MASLLATVVLSPVSIDRGVGTRPRVDRIEPQAAKAGAVVVAWGANLDRSRVGDLMLSNSQRIALTRIIEQSDAVLRFRIPPNLAPGRYQIVLALGDRWGRETLDQQVFLVVLEDRLEMTALGSAISPASAI
jgi:hypothetical protein